MKGVLYFLVFILFLLATVICAGLRINVTSSMPIGFYVLAEKEPERGDWVAVCLPKAIAQEGLRNHYLFYGDCPAHSVPLLKQLIAVPGDEVTLSKEGITVNNRFYLAHQLVIDSRHQKIHYFVKASMNQLSHQYWLYGSHDQLHSWDSRYWGGVDRSAILGVYKPCWVMESTGESESSMRSSVHSPKGKVQSQVARTLEAASSPILGKPKIS